MTLEWHILFLLGALIPLGAGCDFLTPVGQRCVVAAAGVPLLTLVWPLNAVLP